MAKAKTLELPSSKKSYDFPSRFGSHSSMINQAETDKLQEVTKSAVVLTDEYGEYITDKVNLDTGLADPARYKPERLGKLFEKSKDRKDK